MTARLDPRVINQAAPSEAMMRFSIAPTLAGDWRWRMVDQDGRTQAEGLAASRKQAAALVIHHIILSRTAPAAPALQTLAARAA
ncbi:hypothetical protein [Caulobacter sp.]|uniref:hypothetical protein n=1 Tax=Caulobacter sp. TaxID=78 RepID=UPI001B0D28A4|nr:hypothetical protein [Caulobacter sp.]MBO9547274.1 hypothetical protein [Caulobacter sp.]